MDNPSRMNEIRDFRDRFYKFLTMFSMFAAWLGYKMGATEILTAIVGGVFGFLGGVSLRIIENEGPESE